MGGFGWQGNSTRLGSLLRPLLLYPKVLSNDCGIVKLRLCLNFGEFQI